jgi:hypothetical protein
MLAMCCVPALTSISSYIAINRCWEGGMLWIDREVLGWCVARGRRRWSYRHLFRQCRRMYKEESTNLGRLL